MLQRFSRSLFIFLLACAVVLPLAPTAQAQVLQGDNETNFDLIFSVSSPLSSLPSADALSPPSSLYYSSTSRASDYQFPDSSVGWKSVTSSPSPAYWVFRSNTLNIPAGSDYHLSFSFCYFNTTSTTFSLPSAPLLSTKSSDFRVYALQSNGGVEQIYSGSVNGRSTVSINVPDCTYKISQFFVCVGSSSFSSSDPAPLVSSVPSTRVSIGLYSFNSYFKDETQNGLLKGILGSLQNIFSSLLDFFLSITTLIQDFFDFVVTIPELIFNLLIELFVPSSDSLSSISDDFQSVLAGKLGAVWEIGEYILFILSGIFSAGSSSTISFPGISISVAGSIFSIAPASVTIFPPELSLLQETVQIFVTSVFFSAWLVGMQRFFDRILDGGDSE